MRISFTTSVVSASLFFAGSTLAAPFIPKIIAPESYKDIQYGLSEMRDNINSVQCGGWTDTSEATIEGNTISGTIPLPRFSAPNPDGTEDWVALPGRDNVDSLGAPAGGLGQRGDFLYPDSAFGFMSACDVMNMQTMGDTGVAIGVKFHEDGSVGSDNPPGSIDINPFGWCKRGEKMDKATPTWCGRLFSALNQISPMIDAADARPKVGDKDCEVPRKYCFDFNSVCRGQACRTTEAPSFLQIPPACHRDPITDELIITQEEIIIVKQASFYRHYAGDFFEPAITVTVPGEDNVWNVRAECYEYYKEIDTREKVTSKDDEQCEFVIATDGEQTPRKPEWRAGDGHDQKEKVKAEDDVVSEPVRDPRNVPEPWVADTETNLTMIDMRQLKERQKNFEDPTDVTTILGTMITTRQTGSKSTPKNAHTDQFDDTAERKFAAFFEEQQRELLKMTADPQTRLIMPARFLVGLADNDPLFQYVSHTVSHADGTVEITLKAGLDDLGAVVQSFQRIFVAPTQEVRIPLLVPLISVTEIDARIADWKLWKQGTEQRALTLRSLAETAVEPEKKAELLAEAAALDAAALGADPLIEKLLQYREHDTAVRLLRGALLQYLEKFFASQQQIREYFASWYEENSELLVASSQRAVQRRELKRIWRLLQRAMLQTDACQMLWCSNQRYSLPVYSLLDDWWGERPAGDDRDTEYRPPRSLTDLDYQQPKDQVFDFSDVTFSGDAWLVPTLWPVEVRISLPVPPAIGVQPPSPDQFPTLPPLPDETVFDEFPVPRVELPEKPRIEQLEPDDLEPAKDILRDLRLLIDGTSIDDQRAEEQRLAEGESIDGGDDNYPLDRESMRGTYCRFPQSILIPPDSKSERYRSDPAEMDHSDPADEYGSPAKIIHVESDLRERLARLFSRWMPQREEDYAGRSVRLAQEFSPENPPECHEDLLCYLLPPEMRTVTTWQWFMPDVTGGNFTELGDQLRDETLPKKEEENPYYGANLTTLRRIFPLLDLPITTKLDVPRTAP